MFMNTFSSELLAALLNRGFSLNANGVLTYAKGSICNYTDVTIYPPITENVYDDVYMTAAYVEYHSFADNGSILGSYDNSSKQYIDVNKLLSYLHDKGIRNPLIRQEERKAFRNLGEMCKVIRESGYSESAKTASIIHYKDLYHAKVEEIEEHYRNL